MQADVARNPQIEKKNEMRLASIVNRNRETSLCEKKGRDKEQKKTAKPQRQTERVRGENERNRAGRADHLEFWTDSLPIYSDGPSPMTVMSWPS